MFFCLLSPFSLSVYYRTGCNRRFAVISNLRRHFKVHAPKKSASRLSYQERLRRIQRLEASLSTTLTIPILSSPHPIQPKKEYFAAALSGSSPRSMLSSTTEREGQQQQQQQQQSNSINNDNNNNNQQQQHQLLTPPLMPIISVKTPGNMMLPVHTRTTTYQSLASALTPNPLTTTCCDGYPILCTPLSQDIPNQQQFAPQAVPFDMSQPPHHLYSCREGIFDSICSIPPTASRSFATYHANDVATVNYQGLPITPAYNQDYPMTSYLNPRGRFQM